jgi:hypothetical protein
MATQEVDVIYLGRDNVNELVLKADKVGQPLDSVTQIELEFDDGTEITNSTGDAWPIKWLNQDQDGKIQLQLGGYTITAGERTCRIATIDPTNQDGIVWSGQNGVRFFVTAAT